MKIQLFADRENESILFKNCLNNLTLSEIEDEPLAEVDLIIVSINAPKNERSNRLGISLIQKIRRNYFIQAPIIVYSFESFEKLGADFPILKTKGISFLQLPFFSQDLVNQADSLQNQVLSEPELFEIVHQTCNPKEDWRMISHKIGNYLSDYCAHKSQIENLVSDWAKTIRRFAPECVVNLEELQQSINLPFKSINIDELKLTVQKLDECLQGKEPKPDPDLPKPLPKRPPKGFSKVFIADDEAMDSLKLNLQNEYNYQILGQAKSINEAKRQVKEKLPTVILSDFYFKNYEHDKTTDKRHGIDFMEFAESYNVGSKDFPQTPIVAVISKTSLDPNEIPKGVLDCSGTRNATNPEFIHSAIWTEAIRRGVTETEIIDDDDWKLEYICRQRLEPYKSDLPKTIRQWNSFKETVRETFLMIQSIEKSAVSEESAIIERIIETLKPYRNNADFSLEEVTKIFSKIEKLHQEAKQPPESEIKTLIRNILHGKIEQFSSVTNHIEFALKVFAEVSSDLILLPQFNKLSVQLQTTLAKYSEKKPLMPFLILLQNDLDLALDKLPLPKPIPPIPIPSIKRKINIIAIEDNQVWIETVLSSVERTKARLGKNAEIVFKHFDNSEEALSGISEIIEISTKENTDNEVINIAIVDICIPENDKIPNQIPDMKNGIEILKNLSDYTINIPIIVFSTKSSLEDIRNLGKFGISDENFISKESFDPESIIAQSIINLIEKNQKFPVRKFERERNGEFYYEFSIDGILIPFTNKLKTLFQAFLELREDGYFENKIRFTTEEIYKRIIEISGGYEIEFTNDKKHYVQTQINEIRKFIYSTFQKNNRYINIKNLIKTHTSDSSNKSYYELNAELSFFDYDEPIIPNKPDIHNVLIINKDKKLRNQILGLIKGNSYRVKTFDPSNENLEKTINLFRPSILCLNLLQVEYGKVIKSILQNERLGVIITTTNDEPNKKMLIGIALRFGISSRNFISTNKKDWVNSLLTLLDSIRPSDEPIDYAQDFIEPIVEILPESDLSSGILKLRINGVFFTMNKSNISKIIGLLLLNPKTLISLEKIKLQAIGSSEPVTKDEQTGWTRKIRNQIQDKWLKTEDRNLAMEILDSSEQGMKLNVQVIYSQADK